MKLALNDSGKYQNKGFGDKEVIFRTMVTEIDKYNSLTANGLRYYSCLSRSESNCNLVRNLCQQQSPLLSGQKDNHCETPVRLPPHPCHP